VRGLYIAYGERLYCGREVRGKKVDEKKWLKQKKRTDIIDLL
jgi:hypothetical protein